MVTITIDNSYSRIEGLKIDEFRALRKLLSYTIDPKQAYFSGGFLYPRYLIDKKGYFPTGLFMRVRIWAADSVIPTHVVDNRVKPPNRSAIEFSGPAPYPDQDLALDAALWHKRGGLVLPTGTGKSLVIAMLIAKLNVRTLVVVPNLELKNQLSQDLAERLGNRSDIVVVENIDSPRLKELTNFDCLIIDECHHSASRTYQNLNKTAWNGIYYRFFLTATFFRNQQNEQLLFEGIVGEEIFRLSQQDAIKKGYIVPIEAYYIDLPKTDTKAHTWREVYNQLIVNNDYRNKSIARILQGLHIAGVPTLCLVKEVAHGKILSKLSGSLFINGQDDESRSYIHQFNNGEIKSLIGTTGVIGEGINSRPAEYIIIAGLGKAKSAFMQQIGRGVRKYPGKKSAKIVLFRDISHKFLLRHFKEQTKILKEEYGVKVLKLEDL